MYKYRFYRYVFRIVLENRSRRGYGIVILGCFGKRAQKKTVEMGKDVVKRCGKIWSRRMKDTAKEECEKPLACSIMGALHCLLAAAPLAEP